LGARLGLGLGLRLRRSRGGRRRGGRGRAELELREALDLRPHALAERQQRAVDARQDARLEVAEARPARLALEHLRAARGQGGVPVERAVPDLTEDTEPAVPGRAGEADAPLTQRRALLLQGLDPSELHA